VKKEEFCFDGTAKVMCRKCKTLHEVAFDGTDLDTCVEDAIERGMNDAGWEVSDRLCPNCWEEFAETNEDVDEEDDEYDVELDDSEYDDFDDEEE
jgi:hypothetical protein